MPGPESLAPWLAMAATGALHGLHPASGWPLMVAGGQRGRGLLRALWPLALGQLAAVLLVVGPALLPVPRAGVPGWLAGAGWALAAALLLLLLLLLLMGLAGWRARAAMRRQPRLPRGAGLVLGGCGLTLLQGTGLALVPMLGGWCGPGTAPGPSLLPALAALGLHLAAMFAAGGLAAYAVAAGWARGGACRMRVIAALAWCTKSATASGCPCSVSSAKPR